MTQPHTTEKKQKSRAVKEQMEMNQVRYAEGKKPLIYASICERKEIPISGISRNQIVFNSTRMEVLMTGLGQRDHTRIRSIARWPIIIRLPAAGE
jgi:hypothetical protein